MLIDAHTILFLIPLVVDLTSCVYSYFRLSTESQQKHEKCWEWKILEEPTKSTDLCQKIKNLSQRWLTVGGGEDLSLRRTFSMSWTSGCLRRKSLWASTRCGYWVPSSLSMAAVDSVTDSLSLERVRWGCWFIGLHRWGFGSRRERVREKVRDQVREREKSEGLKCFFFF